MGADAPVGPICSVCKKPRLPAAAASWIWACGLCALAGRIVEVCSPRCRRVHERDGLHRRERRKRERSEP